MLFGAWCRGWDHSYSGCEHKVCYSCVDVGMLSMFSRCGVLCDVMRIVVSYIVCVFGYGFIYCACYEAYANTNGQCRGVDVWLVGNVHHYIKHIMYIRWANITINEHNEATCLGMLYVEYVYTWCIFCCWRNALMSALALYIQY